MKKILLNFIRYQLRQGFPLGLIIFAKFQKKIGLIYVTPVKIKYPVWLRSQTSDVPTFDEIFVANHYDYNYGFVPETIIDCGANVGLATVFFKNKFPQATVIAIEPEKSNFEMLEKNAKPYNNVYCVNAGVWNKETNLKGSEKYGSEKWTFSVEESNGFEDKSEMPALSVNNLMAKYNLDSIGILKIDIEGSELELFSNNTENWLPKTKCVVIELHDRLRKGCGTAFFKAMSQYDFSYDQKGVNMFCINNKM